MRSLVIGGTLFIGQALVRKLIERGDDVTILHRGRHNPFGAAVREVRCDRNDPEAIGRAMREGRYDLVFDNVYDWQRGTTAEQVEAAATACGDQLRRYVFTSSCAAYGEGLDHREDDALAPPDYDDAYCRNKANTERMLFRLHRERGLPAVTLRPPFLYGPENPFYREQFFWDRMLAGRPIILPGDGTRLMQFVFVHDYVEAAIAAAEREIAAGRAYNVANAAPVTQRELVERLAEAAGCPPPQTVSMERETLIELGGDAFQPPYYFAQYYDLPPITEETSRARSELGFEATPFVEGLRQTFEWYRSTERPEPDFSFDDKALAAIGYRAK
jgi:nucleoside-diphosphate-sugar epimerase